MWGPEAARELGDVGDLDGGGEAGGGDTQEPGQRTPGNQEELYNAWDEAEAEELEDEDMEGSKGGGGGGKGSLQGKGDKAKELGKVNATIAKRGAGGN